MCIRDRCAHINLGPVYRQALTKRVPLLGGLSMMVLPMAYNARLEWNTSTNRLRAIKDSSSVKIWYTTASEFIDSVNNWVGDGSNALTVFGALLEASKNAGNDEPNIEDPVIDGTRSVDNRILDVGLVVAGILTCFQESTKHGQGITSITNPIVH